MGKKDKELNLKFLKLQDILKNMGSVLLAFSGGVDSAFLLKCANETLQNNVIAVTAVSETYPSYELKRAKELAKLLKVKHLIIRSEELKDPRFFNNPPERCYFCKLSLFKRLKEIAKEKGINYVIEGSNLDDIKDYRPGKKAISELGIHSPLKDAGLTKDEIRQLSKKMGLKSYSQPSSACLASRFPYGEKITIEKLKQVEKAEAYLRKLGFKQFRVRYHREIARIELSKDEMNVLLSPELREKVYSYFQRLGFPYTALDLLGYRQGSLNLFKTKPY